MRPLRAITFQTGSTRPQRGTLSAGERQTESGLRLLQAWPVRGWPVLVGAVVHGQASLFGADNFGDKVVTATASRGRAAVIANFRDAAGARGSDGTTDISVSEGVAVTHEHRLQRSVAY